MSLKVKQRLKSLPSFDKAAFQANLLEPPRVSASLLSSASAAAAAVPEEISLSDFQNSDLLPTDYELVHLANIVYSSFKEQKDLLQKSMRGWQLVFTGENSKDSYYGAAYLKGHMLVIAHRGTDEKIKEFLEVNDESVMHHRVSSQMASAEEFVQTVLKAMEEKYLHLSFTGHSLGGWLAQISAFHAEERNLHAHVVTLDSPGGREILNELQPNVQGQIPLECLDITTYLAAPDLINVCNHHIGAVYRIFPNLPEWKNIKKPLEFIQYTSSNHARNKLVECFKADTGKPKKYKEVKSWPSVVSKQKNTSGYKGIAFYKLAYEFIKSRDDDQYNEFFKWANRRNDYNPELKDFSQRYRLAHRAKYRIIEPHATQCLASIFDRKTLSFLQSYALLRRIFNGATPDFKAFSETQGLPHVEELLADYQMTEGMQNKEKRLLIVCKERPLKPFIRAVQGMMLANPNFSEHFEDYLKKIMPTMQAQITTVIHDKKITETEISELKNAIHLMKKQFEQINLLQSNNNLAIEEVIIEERIKAQYLLTPGAKLPDVPVGSFWERELSKPPPEETAVPGRKTTVKKEINAGKIAVLDIFNQLEKMLSQTEVQKKTQAQEQAERKKEHLEQELEILRSPGASKR